MTSLRCAPARDGSPTAASCAIFRSSVPTHPDASCCTTWCRLENGCGWLSTQVQKHSAGIGRGAVRSSRMQSWLSRFGLGNPPSLGHRHDGFTQPQLSRTRQRSTRPPPGFPRNNSRIFFLFYFSRSRRLQLTTSSEGDTCTIYQPDNRRPTRPRPRPRVSGLESNHRVQSFPPNGGSLNASYHFNFGDRLCLGPSYPDGRVDLCSCEVTLCSRRGWDVWLCK